MRTWIARTLCAILFVAALPLLAVAQDQQQPPAQTQPDKSDKDKKKEKKDKKKKDKKDDSGAQDVLNTEVFSDRVADDVLGLIRDGLEGHSYRLMLSAFDGDKMDGYLSFEDAIEAMFARYEGFRVHYRILQATSEGSKAVVLTTFQMEEIPKADARGTSGAPQRRENELRFELERGKKGWRVVDFQPRGFFS